MSNEKFYTKNWFVICSLIFFLPLGLFLMWYYKKFTQNWRVGLTVFMCTMFLFSLGDSNEESNSTTQESPKVKETKKETKEEKEKPEQSEVERKAEEARKKIQADKKKMAEEKKKKEKEKQNALERRANAETIDYAVLEKKADSYSGAYVRYEGWVGNIREVDGQTNFNLFTNPYATNFDSFYIKYEGKTDFVDGDFVRVFGTLDGMYQYETVKRDYAQMPLIEAEFVEEVLD